MHSIKQRMLTETVKQNKWVGFKCGMGRGNLCLIKRVKVMVPKPKVMVLKPNCSPNINPKTFYKALKSPCSPTF